MPLRIAQYADMERAFYSIVDQEAVAELPPTSQALEEPNGLLAAGGDLSIDTLISAYKRGIFPWYSEGQPILWWSPNPRCIIDVQKLVVSRSLKKSIKNRGYTVTFDKAFARVIQACGDVREEEEGTWILPEMYEAYNALHRVGIAHSVETWLEDELIGGLYGVAVGKMFFGESMFTKKTDASKVAFTYLVNQLREWGFSIIDCQVETDHLMSLGAELIERHEFESIITPLVAYPSYYGSWELQLSKAELLSML